MSIAQQYAINEALPVVMCVVQQYAIIMLIVVMYVLQDIMNIIMMENVVLMEGEHVITQVSGRLGVL